MPIPQHLSPSLGHIAEMAQGIRLSLAMDPKRDYVPSGNGSIFHLKEVSLFYEKARSSDHQPNSPYNDSYRSPHQNSNMSLYRHPNQRPSVSYRQIGRQGSNNVELDSTDLPTTALMHGGQLPHVNATHSTSSVQKSVLPSYNIEELFQTYRMLVLEKYQCRSSLDKSIDKLIRQNLEKRYFAVAEALVACEERIRNAGYGRYLPEVKKHILGRHFYVPAKSNNLQRLAHIPSPITGREVSSEDHSLTCNQHEKYLTISNANSSSSSFDKRKSIISKAKDLYKIYHKVNRTKCSLREKLATGINDIELRKKIENEYFNAQIKLEKIHMKLIHLANKIGMDWVQLSGIIIPDQHNGLLHGSHSRSIQEMEEQANKDFSVPFVPHLNMETLSNDDSWRISEYYNGHLPDEDLQEYHDSIAWAYDIDKLKNGNDSGTYRKSSFLEDKGIQTDCIDVNNNSIVGVNSTEEAIYGMEPIKTALDKTSNYVDTFSVASKVCICIF